jgi:hypothetical protein
MPVAIRVEGATTPGLRRTALAILSLVMTTLSGAE